MDMKTLNIINDAISKRGGDTKFARRLTEVSGMECNRDIINGWRRNGVSAKWALWFEKETGVSRHVICNTALPLEVTYLEKA